MQAGSEGRVPVNNSKSKSFGVIFETHLKPPQKAPLTLMAFYKQTYYYYHIIYIIAKNPTLCMKNTETKIIKFNFTLV